MSLTLPGPEADRFLATYGAILVHVIRRDGIPYLEDPADAMDVAREHLLTDPKALDVVLAEREAAGEQAADPEVVAALRTLVVREWTYLRDTPTGSILIAPAGDEAFVAVGLRDPLRAACDGAGKPVRAGLVRFAGRYVCDGVIDPGADLSSTAKKAGEALLVTLKATRSYRV